MPSGQGIFGAPKNMVVDTFLSKYYEWKFRYHLSTERDEGKTPEQQAKNAEVRRDVLSLAYFAKHHPDQFNIDLAIFNSFVEVIVDHLPFPHWFKVTADELLGQTPRKVVDILNRGEFQDQIPPGFVPSRPNVVELIGALGPTLKLGAPEWMPDFLRRHGLDIKEAIDRCRGAWTSAVNAACEPIEVLAEGASSFARRQLAAIEARKQPRTAA